MPCTCRWRRSSSEPKNLAPPPTSSSTATMAFAARPWRNTCGSEVSTRGTWPGGSTRGRERSTRRCTGTDGPMGRPGGGRPPGEAQAAAPARDGEPAARRAVTIDFWGTLVVEPPLFDECYRRSRLAALRRILVEAGTTVTVARLDRAYDALGAALAARWGENRDLSAE